MSGLEQVSRMCLGVRRLAAAFPLDEQARLQNQSHSAANLGYAGPPGGRPPCSIICELVLPRKPSLRQVCGYPGSAIWQITPHGRTSSSMICRQQPDSDQGGADNDPNHPAQLLVKTMNHRDAETQRQHREETGKVESVFTSRLVLLCVFSVSWRLCGSCL